MEIRCSRCKNDKPADSFHFKNQKLGKRSSVCKVCQKAYNSEHYRSNADKYRGKAKEWKKANPVKNRNYKLKQTYGVSVDVIDDLRESQERLCAICGDPERSSDLVIDHCHSTSKVRAILCRRCNLALGLMADNPEYLKQAAEYLNSHRISGEAS